MTHLFTKVRFTAHGRGFAVTFLPRSKIARELLLIIVL